MAVASTVAPRVVAKKMWARAVAATSVKPSAAIFGPISLSCPRRALTCHRTNPAQALSERPRVLSFDDLDPSHRHRRAWRRRCLQRRSGLIWTASHAELFVRFREWSDESAVLSEEVRAFMDASRVNN